MSTYHFPRLPFGPRLAVLLDILLVCFIVWLVRVALAREQATPPDHLDDLDGLVD